MFNPISEILRCYHIIFCFFFTRIEEVNIDAAKTQELSVHINRWCRTGMNHPSGEGGQGGGGNTV